MQDKYKGQCFCYPTVTNCEHCNRARAWVDQDVLVLANELAEGLQEQDAEEGDIIQNVWELKCPECGETAEEHPDPNDEHELACSSCNWTGDENDCESEPQEIFQWWIISKWLYEQLKAIGVPVADWKGQYWWGRTCCGQAIELDGTFQRISRSL